MLDGKKILITGGTGSFGKRYTQIILNNYSPKEIRIYSRDELKQYQMKIDYPVEKYPIKYFIGDVRDSGRLTRVIHSVDYVIHAAALKQVPTAEFNPYEAVKTNIIGAQNIIDASLENNVKKVIALSTDKACSPINLYGATKLASDKLFSAANHWQGSFKTSFSVVRYGNVVGSRGSVFPFFLSLKDSGIIPVTDTRMTRFSITLEEAVSFVNDCFRVMQGGEIFVPKIPSYRILDVVKAIAPKAKIEIIGIRPGEKIHEIMISQDDALNTLEYKKYFIIQPSQPWWDGKKYLSINKGKNVDDNFSYSSENNNEWLGINDLRALSKNVKKFS